LMNDKWHGQQGVYAAQMITAPQPRRILDLGQGNTPSFKAIWPMRREHDLGQRNSPSLKDTRPVGKMRDLGQGIRPASMLHDLWEEKYTQLQRNMLPQWNGAPSSRWNVQHVLCAKKEMTSLL
jgi:hypothetical protein